MDPALPDHKLVWLSGYAVPPAMKIRPVQALKGVFNLIRNKEDTQQVYAVTNNLSGRAHIEKFRQFIATDLGRKVIEKPVLIEKQLANLEYLTALPKGTVGRAYADFMSDEKLSTTALLDATRESGVDYVNAPKKFQAFCRQVIHFKVTHDLWHVLSGYGRDGLGEICLLRFYTGQWNDRGIRLIVTMAGRSMARQMPHVPIKAAISEAYANGRAARWIMGFDVDSYLERPLEEVRAEMGIRPPTLYDAVKQEDKARLLAPQS